MTSHIRSVSSSSDLTADSCLTALFLAMNNLHRQRFFVHNDKKIPIEFTLKSSIFVRHSVVVAIPRGSDEIFMGGSHICLFCIHRYLSFVKMSRSCRQLCHFKEGGCDHIHYPFKEMAATRATHLQSLLFNKSISSYSSPYH
jgi:hypothetical protein